MANELGYRVPDLAWLTLKELAWSAPTGEEEADVESGIQRDDGAFAF